MIPVGVLLILAVPGRSCALGYFLPGGITGCVWLARFVTLGFIFSSSGIELLFTDREPGRDGRYAS